MTCAGLCCARLEEPRTLMKMGLSVLLVGHVNFLLGALMHGVVLRHVGLHKQARAVEYAVANVVALASGLVGIVVGVLAIVLSKKQKSRGLTWSLFSAGLVAALMAAASAIGLSVSMVRAIVHSGRSLLTHCRFPDAVGYSSITNECPFDPTRIYSTALILWVPLIVTCFIQMVFAARCSAVCVSFLGLPCCPGRKRAIHVGRSMEEAAPTCSTDPLTSSAEPPGNYSDPPTRYSDPTTRYMDPPTHYSDPPTRYSEPPTRYSDPPTRYSDPSTRYSDPPTRYSDPPTRYSEPPTRYSDPPTRYSDPSTRYSEPPTRYSEPPTRYSEPPTRYSDPPTRYSDPPTRYSDPQHATLTPQHATLTPNTLL